MEAQTEVERLTAGADPSPRDPNCWPTPGQWIHEWNQASPERRLEMAAQAVKNAQDAAGPQTITRLLGIGTFVLHVQPDDVLLIGKVNGHAEELSPALDELRKLWPERRVVLFNGDIDVQAISPAALGAL